MKVDASPAIEVENTLAIPPEMIEKLSHSSSALDYKFSEEQKVPFWLFEMVVIF